MDFFGPYSIAFRNLAKGGAHAFCRKSTGRSKSTKPRCALIKCTFHRKTEKHESYIKWGSSDVKIDVKNEISEVGTGKIKFGRKSPKSVDKMGLKRTSGLASCGNSENSLGLEAEFEEGVPRNWGEELLVFVLAR